MLGYRMPASLRGSSVSNKASPAVRSINNAPRHFTHVKAVSPALPRTSSVATGAQIARRTSLALQALATDEEVVTSISPPVVETFTPAPHLVVPGEPAAVPGVTLHKDSGESSFRVWAPHAASAFILLKDQYQEVPLTRQGDFFAARLAAGALQHGAAYKVLLYTHSGERLERRDPYAHQTDYESEWCFVDDPTLFKWSEHTLRPFDEVIIYEMHVGSFTPQGTFASAMEKLEHIASLGFTQVQLMPLTEHSDAWGYNPRQLMSIHGGFGSPDELRQFVDRAHQLGMGVIIDVVLHHGAVERNALWEYDGWGPDWNGGIYHEGGHDTQWGRSYGFWKREVRDMIEEACRMYLRDFNCDGLRFDSANDLPADVVQELTWRLHESFPGRILTAEVTPENPMSVHQLGFDAVWVHSGYFDIIQQHRALGRGHHGGGDWADGWNLPRLRTVMILHYGFEKPTQCIKYLLGSHDQVGCRKGGAWYKDYEMIGGQHRYAVDQFGGGRTDPHATASARLWYAANVAAAGLPMMFMGTEWAQGGWWDIDEHRRMQWVQGEDTIGQHMMAAVSAANKLRLANPSMRSGWANILHEDRPNGVVAFERVLEGEPRIVCVINAGRKSFQGGNYGCWVGGGSFEEIYSSHDPAFGGWEGVETNGGEVRHSHDGKLWLNLPGQCTLIFRQVYQV